jgi:hypothetical protein
MIKPMLHDVATYISRFNLAAIALTRDGRLISTQDPAGMQAAWWCASSKVGAIIRSAQRDDGDVVAAARRLQVPLAEHTAVIAKVTKAMTKINHGLEWARRTGALRSINAEFKRRRLDAERRGDGFMRYGEVVRRLHGMMSDVAAGAPMPRDLVVRVFDGGKSGPLST